MKYWNINTKPLSFKLFIEECLFVLYFPLKHLKLKNLTFLKTLFFNVLEKLAIVLLLMIIKKIREIKSSLPHSEFYDCNFVNFFFLTSKFGTDIFREDLDPWSYIAELSDQQVKLISREKKVFLGLVLWQDTSYKLSQYPVQRKCEQSKSVTFNNGLC